MKHRYFTKGELVLWGVSVLAIVLSFLLLDRGNHLTLLASLVGVTSLIFCAKGNPVGQLLMVLFSMVYGYISLTFSYYGEMLTYLCMTMPMAVGPLSAATRAAGSASDTAERERTMHSASTAERSFFITDINLSVLCSWERPAHF